MHFKIKCPLYNNGTDHIPFFEMHCGHILLYNIISKYTKKNLAGLLHGVKTTTVPTESFTGRQNHHSILFKNLL
jgi:hypothetical protein